MHSKRNKMWSHVLNGNFFKHSKKKKFDHMFFMSISSQIRKRRNLIISSLWQFFLIINFLIFTQTFKTKKNLHEKEDLIMRFLANFYWWISSKKYLPLKIHFLLLTQNWFNRKRRCDQCQFSTNLYSLFDRYSYKHLRCI